MAISYEAGIRLILSENVAAGLANIVAAVFRAEGSVKKLEAAFGSLNKTSLLIGGAMSTAFGVGVFAALSKVTDKAYEFEHALVQLQKLGPAAYDGATKAAITAAAFRTPGTTFAGAADAYGKLYSLMGVEGAKQVLDPILKYIQVVGNTSGDYKGASEKVYDIVKTADQIGRLVDTTTGKVDPAKLARFLELSAKIGAATHGKVDARQLYQMSQTGAPALSTLSDAGLETLGIAAQAVSGFRAGTSLMALFSQMEGGAMAQYKAKNLQRLGLVGGFTVGKGGNLQWDQGEGKGLDSPFTRAIREDPLKAEAILKRALVSHGFDTIEKQVPELFKILGRQTTIRLVHEMLRNSVQMIEERGRLQGGLGIFESLRVQEAQDPMQIMQDLSAAIGNLWTALGDPLIETKLGYMKDLSSLFDSISDWALKNPDDIRNIAQGFGVLGTMLLGGGGLAILAALGPAGWFVLGIGSLAAAFVAFHNPIAKYLQDIEDVFGEHGAIRTAIGSFLEWAWSFRPHFTRPQPQSYEGPGFGDDIARVWNTSYGGAGGGGIGGPAWSSTGSPAVGHGGGWGAGSILGQGTAARGTLLSNQKAAYAAALVDGLSSDAAKALAANFSGESLKNPADYHWDVRHMSQGIGQWDPTRSAAIKRQFGKYPKDMSVAEQTHAAIWEMKTKYHKAWRALTGGGSAASMIPPLVDYESPGNKAAAIHQRLNYLKGLPFFSEPALANHPLQHHSIEPPHHRDQPPIFEHTMLLDGEVVHRSVTRRQVAAARHPTSAAYHDGSRGWLPPGDAQLITV
jgi:Phage tail lysozyme